jgi:NAD(P)-dependent dehydrogenase (short-subunit alcohol dehydrogenase family)
MKIPFQIDLTDKVVVVTGAGGVLCSMFAKAIAECGAKVALLGRHIENVQALADEITKAGHIAKAYKIDVLDKEGLEKARISINEELGTCDMLINGAGGNSPKATTTNEYYFDGDLDKDITTFFNLDPKGIESVFNLNFLGTLIPTQVFAQDMLNKDDASIINISSMNAFTPLTKIPAYSGAKAAINNFTQWLAVHFANSGIRVNAIAPGFFVTKQNKDLLFNEDGTPKERTNKILNSTPMGRFGESEELIGTLLFLLSKPASSFVTGVVIPVDGGFSAYSGV